MTLRLAGLFLCLLLTACGLDGSWRGFQENRQGVAALGAQNPAAAQAHFLRALPEAPLQAELHLNLALALDGLKRSEESKKSYQSAETLTMDPRLRFAARFNQGEMAGRAKRIDEALDAYQRALEIDPASREVKTNIELLLAGGSGQGDGDGQDQSQDPSQGNSGDPKKDPQQDADSKGDQDKPDQPKEGPRAQSPKYQPRPFKGELSESDVKKILGEVQQQEQRIRAEFNRKEGKEQPRDKDW